MSEDNPASASKSITFLRAVIASAVLALVVALISAALAAGGVISMAAVEVLLLLAWLVGFGAVVLSEKVLAKPRRYKTAIAIGTAVLWGGILIWLHHWIAVHGLQQVSVPPTQPLLTPVPSTNVPESSTDVAVSPSLSGSAPVKPARITPSFAFIVPGPWVNNNTWDFIVTHRGPGEVYNADFLFVDKVRLERLQKSKSSFTPGDINSYTKRLHYDEIDPKGRGSVFARQFLWTPDIPEHEHFEIQITSRNGSIFEDLLWVPDILSR